MLKLERISPIKLYCTIILASVFPFVAVALFKDQFYTVINISTYLVFHNVAEFFSVIVSFSIFGLGWYAYDQNKELHSLFLSVAFFSIGLIDFMHTLGYFGMPQLITPNVTNKAILFWLFGRFLTAAVLFATTFITSKTQNCTLRKPALISSALILSSTVFIGIIFFPEYIPAAFIPGIGLTAFKVITEYVIIILLLITFLLYLRRISKTGENIFQYYQVAILLCIFSELSFTLYKSAFDTYNMLGHIYKVIAFFLIYKGIFVFSVRKPYEKLTTLNDDLHHQAMQLEDEMAERQVASEELQLKTIELEEEIEGRRLAQQSLEEQAVILEEEISERTRIQAEHDRLEEQLRQSQKMEAIGLLAGGVAHDFNNILTVIMGYCSLLNMKSKLDDEDRSALDCINLSAEKAAGLTRSLLAFSHKQIMEPKPLELNDLVKQVNKFLIRIIGEDITLKSIYSTDKLKVFADAGQIEQVLMNLSTNARDAMPKGGTLTIETAFQEIDDKFVLSHGYGVPGFYALISVSDTGIGMDENTQKRIFEPFFTTKEVGKGTGLGMSIVHGIIGQHKGFVYVDSEVGKGTTFKIFIPLMDKSRQLEAVEEVEAPLRGGSETILVVEDDTAVRNLV